MERDAEYTGEDEASEADRFPVERTPVVLNPKLDLLPINSMTPRAFEALMRTIAAKILKLRNVRFYGVNGQEQYGVDVTGMAEGRLLIGIQAKRVQDFSPRELRTAVEKYATSSPPFALDRFIVAVSCVDDHREITNELYRLERVHSGLVIDFWDQQTICDLLRTQPDIVTEFFGGEAVAAFCVSGSPLARVNTLQPACEMFVGRLEQLSTITEIITTGGQCLITGTPGIGKTELALQSVRRAVENARSTDALFVDLHGYSTKQRVDPAHALRNLLVQLGFPEVETPADPAAAVARYQTALDQRAQAGRRVVLVLDNADSYEQIHTLLPASPAHRVVVTSRDFMYDWVGVRRVALSALAEDEGVTLIENVVRSALPADTRAATQHRAAVEIGRLCGGLPLALVIVAGILIRYPDQALRDVANTLTDTRTRLANLRLSNRAIRTAFDSSYATLSADEARAFRLLALHPGNRFDTAAVAALLDSSTEQTQRTVEVLASTSLINNDAAAWRMHDLLRLYAKDLLEQHESADIRQAALVRLLDHFCESAETTARRFVTPDFLSALRNRRPRALSWFDNESETLVVALNTAYGVGLHKQVLRLANSLGEFWAVRPLSLDWLAIFTYAVDSARVLDAEEAIAHFLRFLGDTCVQLKQFDRATEHFSELIQISASPQLDAMRAAAWNGLANVHLDCGDPASAIRCGEQALAIFHELGDQRNESAVLGNLANAYRNLRWLDAAFKLYHDSLAIDRSLGDKQSEGINLTNLARAHRMRGDLTEAIDYLETALSLRTSIGDINGAAKACSEIANAHEDLGQLTDALPYRERALLDYRKSRDSHGEARELWCIGSLHSRLGQHADAVRHLRGSLDLGTGSDQRRHAHLLNALAAEYCKLRDFPLAIDCFLTALGIYSDYHDTRSVKMVIANLMRAYYDIGVPSAAIQYGREWLKMAEAHDNDDAVEILATLATICWNSGYPAATLDYCIKARRITQNGESAPASLLSLTGFAQVEVGHFTDGIRTLCASLELHDAPAEKASILTALGMAYRGIGEHDKSISSNKSALVLYRALGDRAGEANAMGNLGNTHADLSQAQDAEEHLRAALEIWRQLVSRDPVVFTWRCCRRVL